jgi:PadR family transcriptional regulator PadR
MRRIEVCVRRAIVVPNPFSPLMSQGSGDTSSAAEVRLDRLGPQEYMMCPHMGITMLQRELKRGSTELLILALLEERDRHGYDLARLIDERSRGEISFHVASLYPTLYRMEEKDLIEGRWIEKAGQRRRRYYKLTKAGRKALASQRNVWEHFFDALNRVARITQA